MNNMKTILISISLALFALQLYAQNIILLHSNDMHSKLNGFSPEIEYTPLSIGDDSTMGGFSRIAAMIKKEKSQHSDDIVLAVDAGDFLMGSLFHPLEKSTGFQLGLMHDMGYEYVSIGNHEFDYGPEILAQIITKAMQNGPIPQLLLTNVEFDKNDGRDDSLEALFDKGVIKRFVIREEKGIKIAFLGIYGEDAVKVQPYLEPLTMSNPYKIAKKTAKKLKKSGKADVVIVLSHSGINKSNGEWNGEDVKLAKRGSKYIDAVFSGHSHSITEEACIVNGTPVVQTGAGGKHLGKLVLSRKENRFVMDEFSLLPVDDYILGEKTIQKQIEKQKKLIQQKILDPLQIEYETPVFETNFEMSCDETRDLHLSTLGVFLADAIYHDIRAHGIHTDVSIIAAGVIRDRINPGMNGKQGIADIFRVCSLGQGEDSVPGYPLAQVYVTGKELKNVMEVLLMIRESSTSSYCYYSGIRIYMDANKGFLNKVRKIELGNDKDGWQQIDISRKNEKLYAVSASAYMLEFIGMIKKKTLGLVKVNPKLQDGSKMKNIRDAVLDYDSDKQGVQEGKEWLAFYRYVSGFPNTSDNGIPNMPKRYKTRFNPVINLNKD